MEAAIRWSPHSTASCQRFLVVDVANPSLTLNQVDSISEHNLAYHPVARCSKLSTFSAFDWSKTDESIVALGLSNGSANLVKLRDDGAPSEVARTFRTKQQRKCNSIAFSSQDWLALALEKTRSDVCLFVYDAARETDVPIRRLCAAELVSSVRFFPSQPREIVAATQRALIRLYDLRDDYSSGSALLQASTRNVNNIAIDPLDENYFASAGSTDDPSVTVWDKRWMTTQSSSTGSSTGAVFDFRPALNNSVKTTVWSLRYSGQRRGRLAICSSTGELKIIDMAESGSNSLLSNSDYVPSNPHGGAAAWTTNRYVSESRVVEGSHYDSRLGREKGKRIIAYDWIQDDANDMRQNMITLKASRDVHIRGIPSMKALAVITARQDLTIANGDLSLVEPTSDALQPAPKAPYEQVSGISAEDFGPLDYAGEEDLVEGSQNSVPKCSPDSPRVARILASGTVPRERCRRGYLFDCAKNMQIVAGNWQLERLWEIVARFQDQASNDGMVYREARANESFYNAPRQRERGVMSLLDARPKKGKRVSDQNKVPEKGLDLSYVGVDGLWSEIIGNNPRRRNFRKPAKVEEAVVGLNAAKDIPEYEGERTHFPEHRQLCLAVCGWKFTTDTLERECSELIDRGLYYQAIVQAVLHDYNHIALNLLRTLIRSKTIQNIGLGALLANSDGLNAEQREMCMWMAADTEDPALKALLTFLTTGNWRDVMKTNYLHLGYRLALGLKYLNDTELSGFIQTETARAVKNGDLEGILLTGLGEQAMDLFQTYITRTSDLQTAVLATGFTNPLYVDDVRWEMWCQTYFQQMQVWQCFVPRAKFKVQHSRLARTREGKALLDSPPAQVELRCLHCQNSLAPTPAWSAPISEPLPAPHNAVRVQGPAANAGTVCPHCGRHLPRCGICQLWLGTPRPATTHSTGAVKKTQSSPTKGLDDVMAKLMTFCVSCGHGFHADHARLWFGKHGVCPVPECRCSCSIK